MRRNCRCDLACPPARNPRTPRRPHAPGRATIGATLTGRAMTTLCLKTGLPFAHNPAADPTAGCTAGCGVAPPTFSCPAYRIRTPPVTPSTHVTPQRPRNPPGVHKPPNLVL
eukprot:163713-Chlamydomonas_euryale.AAC.1